ncbi:MULTISPECIES: hypothetical protein [Prochlorococcus]|uniref:Uncharacterized protein n=1 Tax=Prochlorococcus marinus (strain SARG / CCMP1375 / SS120) TaxID=167539 RepID=Q7VAC4_PROMA|nr:MULTISPECIES: hypothetical protein [Prochlorococcus]AAQ00584.1 Predicted protein [Prochlorococcus marinus subsp. marinus str. CCMP1375]KGG10928.1 hypothetical protein EV04_1892 [Prochlorococcus marinus str. LG]KGG20512.1 hypothetical protein EV08_1098 [Prochlorococcus marinus str. SS2]KGG24177.1 hypothetical protein EV09_0784 [Prochlorococcus marinus str. SS35]KGG31565.1 hypothetical protein EV10_1658 [Prochlorococcus marinus str. SS51]
MHHKLFIAMVTIFAPLSFFEQPLTELPNNCDVPYRIGLYLNETSGYRKTMGQEACDGNTTSLVAECWGQGDLPSQKRYCTAMDQENSF